MNIDYEIENLRTWITERQTWINDNLDKLSIIHVNVTFMADDTVVEQRTVNAGLPISQVLPKAPEKDVAKFDNFVFGLLDKLFKKTENTDRVCST